MAEITIEDRYQRYHRYNERMKRETFEETAIPTVIKLTRINDSLSSKSRGTLSTEDESSSSLSKEEGVSRSFKEEIEERPSLSTRHRRFDSVSDWDDTVERIQEENVFEDTTTFGSSSHHDGGDEMTLSSHEENDSFFDEDISLNAHEKEDFENFVQANPISCGALLCFDFPAGKKNDDYYLKDGNSICDGSEEEEDGELTSKNDTQKVFSTKFGGRRIFIENKESSEGYGGDSNEDTNSALVRENDEENGSFSDSSSSSSSFSDSSSSSSSLGEDSVVLPNEESNHVSPIYDGDAILENDNDSWSDASTASNEGSVFIAEGGGGLNDLIELVHIDYDDATSSRGSEEMDGHDHTDDGTHSISAA